MFSKELIQQEETCKLNDELIFFDYEEELKFCHCMVSEEEIYHKAMQICKEDW